MYQQTNSLFYKFRFLAAGLLTVAMLVLTSALVTAMGSNTVLDARSNQAKDAVETVSPDSPNVIFDGASEMINSTHRAAISFGTALYSGSRSITNMAAHSGSATVHGTSAVLNGLASGIVSAAHGAGSMFLVPVRATGTGIMFTLRAPGKLLGAATNGHDVSAIIRPTDNKPVPVISNETSAAVLARLDAQQQQEIASLQTGQLAANRDLGGAIVAGDPKHGGYPAGWDAPLAQDSRLDSWGMYNRECVSYTAWKVYQTYGYMPYWGGVGNANQWVGDARAAGIPTGSIPRIHSVAISMHGYYGHAMWVEAVNGDMIYVSQYNYGLDGQYSEMWVKSSSFTYIYFQ